MPRFTVKCRYCGEEFVAGSTTAKACSKPECQEAYKEDVKKRREELARMDREIEVRKSEEFLKAEESFKKSKSKIDEIVKKAAEAGMTYGQYVGKYGG